ncbi:MAG: acyltransferase [Treponema sp.]|jgi:hypothetical protein|nr:acyltransferase [Treponema sp.]
MSKPYAMPVIKAQPDVKIPEPHISKAIVLTAKLLARLYLLLFFGVARVLLRGGPHLFEAFRRALLGQSRCILAFRHPNGGEPQLLGWFILFRLKSLARKAGVRFALNPHILFVYGYEVVRWGGPVARLVMPRLGAMPIHHAKMDSRSMGWIYRAVLEGPYPIALAPEGQVSYTTESVPRLEQGTIRIGFGAADRIKREGKDIPVEILPVSVHFRFGSWGRLTLEALIRKIEKFTGLEKQKGRGGMPFGERIRPARDHIIEINERRYGLTPGPEEGFSGRIDRIIERALQRAEGILGAGTQGSLFARQYALRQICWDLMIIPGVDSLEKFSPVERGAADLRAGEAWHAGRHLELVDFVWYFRVPLPAEDSPLHYKIEYAQNLWDFANRTMGGAYSNRINIFPRRVIIQAGPPLNISERLPEYHADRHAAVDKAMADLKDAYLGCIDAVNRSD